VTFDDDDDDDQLEEEGINMTPIDRHKNNPKKKKGEEF